MSRLIDAAEVDAAGEVETPTVENVEGGSANEGVGGAGADGKVPRDEGSSMASAEAGRKARVAHGAEEEEEGGTGAGGGG